jgi:hypothetical protein
MLDPRIYRMGLIPVLLAVIVVAFSLGNSQGALTTNLAPDAYNGANAWAAMNTLAKGYPERRPGSFGDDGLATYVAGQLRRYGFQTSTETFSARTADGRRTLENVSGMRAGLGSGSIVLVSHRDALSSPATASLSGTAVMLDLARVLSGRGQQHTIVLASTSGSVGAAGARRLAANLPQPVDAVIVLGDLAGTTVRQPVVVPFSDGLTVAPMRLRRTVAAALGVETGLPAGSEGLGGQFARLAMPITSTEQGPFNAAGDPAVLLSLSSEQGPPPGEPTSKAQITAMGRTVLRTLTALDNGPQIAQPSSYLVWGGKTIPVWAVRVLVLFLILPVLGATIDGLARARRRGESVLAGASWALSAALPFAVASMLVLGAGKAGILGATPGAPLGTADVALHAGGLAVIAICAVVLIGGLTLLWPRLAVRLAPDRRVPGGGAGAGRAAGLLLVLCAVTLALWISNPFAAALLVPALHLWMWIVVPDVRVPRAAAAVLLLVGLAAPVLVGVYYMLVFGLGPVSAVWHWMLALGGGVISPVWAIEWSAVAGCAISVLALVLRPARRAEVEDARITIRGPVTYAGPGSLGGTKSALRR